MQRTPDFRIPVIFKTIDKSDFTKLQELEKNLLLHKKQINTYIITNRNIVSKNQNNQITVQYVKI